MALAMNRASERLSAKDTVGVREETNPTILKHGRIAAHKAYMDMEQEHISLGFEITKDIIANAKRKALF